jgi:hypothetical protein
MQRPGSAPPIADTTMTDQPRPDLAAHHREFLRDAAWSLAVTCEILAHYLDLTDNAGTLYSIRQIWAYAKAIRDVAKLLAVYEHERNNAGQ